MRGRGWVVKSVMGRSRVSIEPIKMVCEGVVFSLMDFGTRTPEVLWSGQDGHYKKTLGDTLNRSPRALAWVLLMPRFRLNTSEAMPLEPKMSNKSF